MSRWSASILNRVASAAHAELLSRACFEHVSTPVLGMIPRDAALALPSRHLGLVQAAEHPDLARVPRPPRPSWSRTGLELDRLQRLARPPSVSLLGPDTRPWPPLGQRIAVARDRAFAFAYAAVLDGWRRQGVELLPVLAAGRRGAGPRAPTRSICPAAIPSCTPAASPATSRFLAGLRAAAARGAFVYGECGGYMTLGRALVDRERPSSRHGRAAAGGHQLRRAQAASRLPPDRAAEPPARSAAPAPAFAATSSTMPARSSAAAAPVPGPLRPRPRPRPAGLPPGPGRRARSCT